MSELELLEDISDKIDILMGYSSAINHSTKTISYCNLLNTLVNMFEKNNMKIPNELINKIKDELNLIRALDSKIRMSCCCSDEKKILVKFLDKFSDDLIVIKKSAKFLESELYLIRKYLNNQNLEQGEYIRGIYLCIIKKLNEIINDKEYIPDTESIMDCEK